MKCAYSLLGLAMVSAAPAADWPQFRGINATGVSSETNLPEKWSKTENIRWKVELPARGISSPVVVGGRVYITANSGIRRDRLHVLCYDAATGKELWHRQLNATGNTGCHPLTNMAAPTPVATADGVYALFACGDLAAFDKDGGLRWYRSLTGDYPTIANQVGMASSPILWKDFLIVPMDSVGESFVAAVDAQYGKNIWKVDRPKKINWLTPLLRTTAERTEVVFPSAGELVSYDPTTGKQLWTYAATSTTISSPVAAGENVLLPSAGLLCVKPEGEKAALVWKAQKLGTSNATPLVYDGKVFTINNASVLMCGDLKTGDIAWDERLKGKFWASPIAGDGKVYAFNDKGLALVVKIGDKGETIAENDLEEEILATPAISDGSLFIRTDKHLYRIGKGKN